MLLVGFPSGTISLYFTSATLPEWTTALWDTRKKLGAADRMNRDAPGTVGADSTAKRGLRLGARPAGTGTPSHAGMLSTGQMEGTNSTFCQADRTFLHRYDFNISI